MLLNNYLYRRFCVCAFQGLIQRKGLCYIKSVVYYFSHGFSRIRQQHGCSQEYQNRSFTQTQNPTTGSAPKPTVFATNSQKSSTSAQAIYQCLDTWTWANTPYSSMFRLSFKNPNQSLTHHVCKGLLYIAFLKVYDNLKWK